MAALPGINTGLILHEMSTHAMKQGIEGVGVLSGCEVTQSSGGADEKVDIAAGYLVAGDGELKTIAGGNYGSFGNTSTTLDRIDLVIWDDSAGDFAIVAGTASANPNPPDPGDLTNDVPIAFVSITHTDPSQAPDVTNSDIYNCTQLLLGNQAVHTASDWKWNNSADIYLYSDYGSTQKIKLDGGTGAITCTSLTDGTATLSSGALSGVTTIETTDDITIDKASGNATLTIDSASGSYPYLDLKQNGTIQGRIQTDSNSNMVFSAGTTPLSCFTIATNVSLHPTNDGSTSLGIDTNEWEDVWAVDTTINHADLAERFWIDKEIDVGTILTIDPNKNESMIPTTKKYQIVSGIASKGGVKMGDHRKFGLESLLCGEIGNIPCKVIGKVKRGDVLVASDVEGYAMVYDKQELLYPYQIVGLAIEENYDEKGIIQVLRQ